MKRENGNLRNNIESSIQSRNIERIGTRKFTEGLKHKKMKERSFHTPKGLHKKKSERNTLENGTEKK